MTQPSQQSTTPPGWFRLWSAVGIAGGIVAVAGMIALLVPAPVPTFGWAAYQPLAETVFLPSPLLTPTTMWGVLALVVGLIVVAFSAGFIVGRRTGSTGSTGSD
ncbi:MULTISPECIES: hypothetical protein [unclassified Leifsonia]|uniref:hypothetical protein n=1 Tax=unclassified Leifsonia TaxID=2663824 RepID=UPI0012FA6442|nr:MULTISPECIES: hypothetical protein [unclassified Leifsonia]